MGSVTHDRPQSGIGSWRVRRRFMVTVILFCMGCIAYVLWDDRGGRVPETVVEMGFITIISVTGSYVFGAAYQDVSTIRERNRRRGGFYNRGISPDGEY